MAPNRPWFLLRALLTSLSLSAALCGCSGSDEVGCYYSPLDPYVTASVTGLSTCADYTAKFYDTDDNELDSVELSAASGSSTTCEAAYLPDAATTLDTVRIDIVETSSGNIVATETADRTYVESTCYTGYDELTVSIAVTS
jgi:hypothetical protein